MGKVDGYADGVVHPFLHAALHLYFSYPVYVVGSGLVVGRLFDECLYLLLAHLLYLLDIVAVDSAPGEEVVVENVVLLEAVSVLVLEGDDGVEVVGVDLAASLVEGQEDGLDAGGGLGHQGCGSGRGNGKHGYVAAAVADHIVVELLVLLADAGDHRVVLLALGVEDGEGTPLLGHVDRGCVGCEG